MLHTTPPFFISTPSLIPADNFIIPSDLAATTACDNGDGRISPPHFITFWNSEGLTIVVFIPSFSICSCSITISLPCSSWLWFSSFSLLSLCESAHPVITTTAATDRQRITVVIFIFTIVFVLINQIIAKMNIREVLVDIEFDPGLALKSAEHRRTQHLLVDLFLLIVILRQ